LDCFFKTKISFYFLKFIEPAICKTIRDLKDSNGVYLKTACRVNLDYTQSSARSTCIAYGMQLYKLNTAEDEAALLAYADSQWPSNSLWVEGGNATSCSAISNEKRANFEKVKVPCLANFNTFYCEYKSKATLIKLQH
jgi:hypothetical protein